MSDCCIESSCASNSVCVEGPCLSTGCWSGDSSFSNFSSSSDLSISSGSSSIDFGNSGSLYASRSDSGLTSSESSRSATISDAAMVPSKQTARQDQGELAKPGEPPKIIVSNDSSVTPDFIVKKDGKVEVVGDPFSGDKPHSVYRIQVEAGANQKDTDALVSQLNDRIRQKDASAQTTLFASPGLVSDDLRKAFEKSQPAPSQDQAPNPEESPNPEENLPPADDSDSPSNPGGGCPGGDCPSNPGTPPDDTPVPDEVPSEVPPQPDALAPVVTPMDNLIDAARLNEWENGANNSLGAYEANMTNWYSSWLTDEMLAELGNPPDFKKLGKVLAKHKNNPKFQEKMNARLGNMREQGDNAGADKISGTFDKIGSDPLYAENFGIFLNGQQSGRNATGEEMQKFFDKDMQKAVASSRIADVAHEAGVKVKDLPAQKQITLALAGALGHIPNQSEMAQYSKYLEVVGQRFRPAGTESLNQLALK